MTDPARVHEILAIAMMVLMLPTVVVALAYIQSLGSFFNELKQKEPEVWQRVGAPGLFGMLVLPFFRFRKYYAFLPVLQERSARAGRLQVRGTHLPPAQARAHVDRAALHPRRHHRRLDGLSRPIAVTSGAYRLKRYYLHLRSAAALRTAQRAAR